MGHWYDREGNPQHFVQGKNGEMRDATLRDARKHHWVPGFSGVTSVLSKPGLTAWFENQLLEAAWEAEIPLPYSSIDEEDTRFPIWKAAVKQAANERSLKARDRGSEIHDAIEHYIKGDIQISPEYEKYIDAVSSNVQEAFSLPLNALEAETTFSSSLGYGGMIDGLSRLLPIGYEEVTDNLKKPKGILLDWKTTQTALADKKKLTYPEHAMQLAAYRDGVKLPNAVCANVFIGPDAEVKIHIWPEDELQAAFEKFKVCLELWKLDRNYRSEW